MNSVSSTSPRRKRCDSVSKSSNSRSRIGMTWPGTSSRTSGFSSVPWRPATVVGSMGSQCSVVADKGEAGMIQANCSRV